MPRCPSRRKLFDLLDRRLPETEARDLRIHLEGCGICNPAFEGMRHVRGALREIGESMPALPAESLVTEGKVMQAIRARGAPRGGIQWWWLPVTAAATLVLAFLLFPRLRGRDEPGAGGRGTVAAADDAGQEPSASGSGRVATVIATRGDVEVGPAGEGAHGAHAGDLLPGGTVVRCSDDCEARLDLVAGGTLMLGAGSRVDLPEDSEGIIHLVAGVLRVSVVPRPEGKRPFGIETPVARVEAIGTDFEVAHAADGTSVEVFEGKVRFVSLMSDEERLVAAGATARADPSGGIEMVDTVAAATPEAADPTGLIAAAGSQPEAGAGEPPEIATTAVQPVRRPRGTIDGGAVRARVSRQRGAFQACYTDFTMRLNPIEVRAKVKFVVLDDGSVGPMDVSLSTASGEALDDGQLRQCIDRVFRAVRFPRPRGGPAQVFYPITLRL